MLEDPLEASEDDETLTETDGPRLRLLLDESLSAIYVFRDDCHYISS